MKKTWIAITSTLVILLFSNEASPAVRIVCSTTDLASIAELIGKDHVKVESIAKGKANPHFVEVLPSYMIKVARADIYLKVGMGLDLWADYIIDGSRNGRIKVIDCSQDVIPLEKPNTRVDASMGDIHPQGNPHYWLDPDNGILMAGKIASALEEVDPENAAFYAQNLKEFKETVEKKKSLWTEKARSLKGIEIITYHNSWPYFCKTFDITVAGFVEPKPGIEPTPAHTAKLIKLVKARGIKIIGKEPYYSDRTPKSIARMTGAKIVNLPPSVGGAEEVGNYFDLFDFLLDRLNLAIKE